MIQEGRGETLITELGIRVKLSSDSELSRETWCWPEGDKQVTEGKPLVPEWKDRFFNRLDL
jgi:hypothetical protein